MRKKLKKLEQLHTENWGAEVAVNFDDIDIDGTVKVTTNSWYQEQDLTDVIEHLKKVRKVLRKAQKEAVAS